MSDIVAVAMAIHRTFAARSKRPRHWYDITPQERMPFLEEARAAIETMRSRASLNPCSRCGGTGIEPDE